MNYPLQILTVVPTQHVLQQPIDYRFYLKEQKPVPVVMTLQELNWMEDLWHAGQKLIPDRYKKATTLGSEKKAFDHHFYMDQKQLVEAAGFGYQEHHVTTDDGYVLMVVQIKNKQVQAGAHPPAVFFQHGLMDTSHSWISQSADKASVFRMAAAGYNVFLGNNRGNSFSNTNTHLDSKKDAEKFYNFSFAELGIHDVPAQLDKVRAISHMDKVTYVGHSQGTTQMFYALAHDQQKIMDKVNLFAALAPVTRIT